MTPLRYSRAIWSSADRGGPQLAEDVRRARIRHGIGVEIAGAVGDVRRQIAQLLCAADVEQLLHGLVVQAS